MFSKDDAFLLDKIIQHLQGNKPMQQQYLKIKNSGKLELLGAVSNWESNVIRFWQISKKDGERLRRIFGKNPGKIGFVHITENIGHHEHNYDMCLASGIRENQKYLIDVLWKVYHKRPIHIWINDQRQADGFFATIKLQGPKNYTAKIISAGFSCPGG